MRRNDIIIVIASIAMFFVYPALSSDAQNLSSHVLAQQPNRGCPHQAPVCPSGNNNQCPANSRCTNGVCVQRGCLPSDPCCRTRVAPTRTPQQPSQPQPSTPIDDGGRIAPTNPPNAPVTQPPSGGQAGDCNGDGKVDLADFNQLRVEFNQQQTSYQCDFDGNGAVDLADFNVLRTNFQ